VARILLHITLGALSLAAPALASAADITVDAGKKFQTIEGFGTCLISWERRMAAYYKTPAAQKTFAEDLRLNIIRCNLWGDGTIGEMPAEKISFKDPAFAARDARTPVFVSFADAIKKLNPELKVIGTVWSPPAWMKENHAIVDKFSAAINGENYNSQRGEIRNRVKKEFYPHFAHWLVEMVKYYEAQGVPFYAISCANEPQFTQTFESCVWTADDLAAITGMVANLLEKEGLGRVKLFGPETMTAFNWANGPNRNYTKKLSENPSAFKNFMFATHGYSDGLNADVSKNSSAQFWEIIKDYGKPYWMTEGGTGGHDWPAPVSPRGVGTAIHNAFVAGNASAFVPWQFAEGGKSEHNIMPTEGMSKKTFTVRQYSRYIPAGSLRVAADPAYGSVLASAFTSPDATGVTVVLINPRDAEEPITLTLKGVKDVSTLEAHRTSASESGQDVGAVTVESDKASVTLPARSIVTLTTVK
jgi:glucuronoarabinoxylan endo-1,4-beta-xylanase